MVANFRNLSIGYVCSHFHIILDELFQTVFCSGEDDIMVDVGFNQLFENNQDVYTKDEFNRRIDLLLTNFGRVLALQAKSV